MKTAFLLTLVYLLANAQPVVASAIPSNHAELATIQTDIDTHKFFTSGNSKSSLERRQTAYANFAALNNIINTFASADATVVSSVRSAMSGYSGPDDLDSQLTYLYNTRMTTFTQLADTLASKYYSSLLNIYNTLATSSSVPTSLQQMSYRLISSNIAVLGNVIADISVNKIDFSASLVQLLYQYKTGTLAVGDLVSRTLNSMGTTKPDQLGRIFDAVYGKDTATADGIVRFCRTVYPRVNGLALKYLATANAQRLKEVVIILLSSTNDYMKAVLNYLWDTQNYYTIGKIWGVMAATPSAIAAGTSKTYSTTFMVTIDYLDDMSTYATGLITAALLDDTENLAIVTNYMWEIRPTDFQEALIYLQAKDTASMIRLFSWYLATNESNFNRAVSYLLSRSSSSFNAYFSTLTSSSATSSRLFDFISTSNSNTMAWMVNNLLPNNPYTLGQILGYLVSNNLSSVKPVFDFLKAKGNVFGYIISFINGDGDSAGKILLYLSNNYPDYLQTSLESALNNNLDETDGAIYAVANTETGPSILLPIMNYSMTKGNSIAYRTASSIFCSDRDLLFAIANTASSLGYQNVHNMITSNWNSESSNCGSFFTTQSKSLTKGAYF